MTMIALSKTLNISLFCQRQTHSGTAARSSDAAAVFQVA
jgi:hypothetical protein